MIGYTLNSILLLKALVKYGKLLKHKYLKKGSYNMDEIGLK